MVFARFAFWIALWYNGGRRHPAHFTLEFTVMSMTKTQLQKLPVGTRVRETTENILGKIADDAATILWDDGVETHYGWWSCPEGTEFSVEVLA